MSSTNIKTNNYKTDLYEIEFGEFFCYCRTFIVNGIVADCFDFGEKYDRDSENAEPYCCSDMKFTRWKECDKGRENECCRKYGITQEQYDEIACKLENGLSFGNCGWCR